MHFVPGLSRSDEHVFTTRTPHVVAPRLCWLKYAFPGTKVPGYHMPPLRGSELCNFKTCAAGLHEQRNIKTRSGHRTGFLESQMWVTPRLTKS